MLYAEGTLRAEDRALRQIARTKVMDALRSIETKTSQILDSLVGKLAAQTQATCSPDQLLQFVLEHPRLQTETATVERYMRAFPELETTVASSRERINTRARIRLERACAPLQYARRFRFTKGAHSH